MGGREREERRERVARSKKFETGKKERKGSEGA